MSTEVTKKDATAVNAISNRGNTFLAGWARNNQDTFAAVMEKLADEMPAKYAELYIRCAQIAQTAPQQKSGQGNTLNVQINKLDTLSDVTDTSWRESKSKKNIQDISYEEIK